IPLNPGPNASLGPEFKVNIPRPRNRTEMNHNDDFKKLRADITRYLLKVGEKASAGSTVIQLPNILPNTAAEFDVNAPRGVIDVSKNIGRERYVEFFKVGKTYPAPKGPSVVVEDFNVNLKKGEFVSIIGHSGCGKSTVLSMAAGLSEITDGGIV